ncbi:MAG TPA: COX15/CtaA family protein, partial [Burkholderiales bacterium]|nr:COX15/CtaA family protein [Burkholderiales bacterium]
MVVPNATPGASRAHRDARKPIAIWLFVCCALVFAMVVVGGVTRLTHSGLSIVEWQPIVGTLPPLSPQEWQETFAKYQQTPEYREVNARMTLGEFKGIFWLEYFHRLLGRLIGAAFFIPLVYFAAARTLDRSLLYKLTAILLLGGLQGGMGWFMVQSGLIAEPRVSQYRLTAHLAIAFAIYATMLWIALDLVAAPAPSASDSRITSLWRHAWALIGVIALAVLSGGFVAGIRAGFAYNTFPLMNGHWVPPEVFMLDPWYENFFNNMATVQFDHRLLALIVAVLGVALWLKSQSAALSRRTVMLSHWLL